MNAARVSPAPDELQGMWRRSLLEWPDGRRDVTTRVRWLQGIRAFADLRQPADLPDFGHVNCLEDLQPADCERLAAQQGFAGSLEFAGGYFEWRRTIDFQPPGPLADAGSLEWSGGILVERGRDAPYVEHWHRDAEPDAPVAALRLHEPRAGGHALLLRVGPHFMYARGRGAAARPLATLSGLVAGASARAARELVDCEISLGAAAAADFRIHTSTLPYRRGAHLAPRLRGDALILSDVAADGTPLTREWTIIGSEGDPRVLDIS